MKIVNSPICSLCGQNVETVTHLFFSCIESHKLWTEIRNWSTSCIILPELTEKIIILGWFEDQKNMEGQGLITQSFFISNLYTKTEELNPK